MERNGENAWEPFTSPAYLATPGTDFTFLGDFLGVAEQWIDGELRIRQAAAQDLSQAIEARGDKTYWAKVREETAWDEAAVVAIHFPGILYGSVIISAHTLMEHGLCRLLSLYRVLWDKPAKEPRGLCNIAEQLDLILRSKDWPSLLATAEWQQIKQWTEVRNALAHASGYLDDTVVLASLQATLGLEFEDTGMGLQDEWEIQLTADNCITMVKDIKALFDWLQTQEQEHSTKRSAESE